MNLLQIAPVKTVSGVAMRAGYLLGLLIFFAIAGIATFLARATEGQAADFEAFKAGRAEVCGKNGLPTTICVCLMERAADHNAHTDTERFMAVADQSRITARDVKTIPAPVLKDAYIRGLIEPVVFKLRETEVPTVHIAADQMLVRAAGLAMAPCAPASLFIDIESYRSRGKAYYSALQQMKRVYRVAEKRRAMIAAGELPP